MPFKQQTNNRGEVFFKKCTMPRYIIISLQPLELFLEEANPHPRPQTSLLAFSLSSYDCLFHPLMWSQLWMKNFHSSSSLPMVLPLNKWWLCWEPVFESLRCKLLGTGGSFKAAQTSRRHEQTLHSGAKKWQMYTLSNRGAPRAVWYLSRKQMKRGFGGSTAANPLVGWG